MDTNSVRLAKAGEFTKALSSTGVIERLSCEPAEVKTGKAHIVNERMLLVLIGHGEAVEAHIAEAKRHWQHIHDDIEQSLIFIQSLGYNQVYTNVRESLKTTLNLLKKHGFRQLDIIDGEVILKWESKQHC
jgi:hypothetical protein